MRTKEIWEREICHTGEQRRCQMPDAWYNSIIFPQAEWILLNNPLDFISSRGAHHVILSNIIQKYSFQHEGTIASCKAHARTVSSRNYTRKPIYIIKNKETMALHRGVGWVGGITRLNQIILMTGWDGVRGGLEPCVFSTSCNHKTTDRFQIFPLTCVMLWKHGILRWAYFQKALKRNTWFRTYRIS